MAEILDTKKKVILEPELYKRNPLWFRGAVAYRLLRIMTPKPLTRRLPTILRRPLLLPGFTFPPDWFLGDILPPGIVIPPGVSFPPGWQPGDPLPDGTIIDTSMLFPDTWQPGDPVPDFVVLPPSAFLPPDWTPADSIPDGLTIDTGIVFPVVWALGDPLPPSVILPPNVPWPPLWSPGDPLPPGAIIDPGTIFPVVWKLGDPIPVSIILAPDGTMPDGWMLGDPLPPGTDIDTGILFPPGWLPSDPFPDGYVAPPDSFSYYPGIGSPVPPTYISPGDPGPVTPSQTTPPSEGPWYVKFNSDWWYAYPGYGSWNSSENRWDATGAYIYLYKKGSWPSGYRPTHVRVEHTGGDLATFAVENYAEEYLTIEGFYVSLTVEPLVYPTPTAADDIYWLYIIGDYPTITNIEFFLE